MIIFINIMPVIICNKCRVAFMTEYTYKRHINRKFPCDTIFQCKSYNKILKNKKTLQTHETKCTNQVASAACDVVELRLKIKQLELNMLKNYDDMRHNERQIELNTEREISKLHKKRREYKLNIKSEIRNHTA